MAGRMGLKLVSEIKFVGAYTGASPGQDEDSRNFANAFEKIERVGRTWGWRRPNALGAVVIVKALMASTATHLLANFTLSKEETKRFNKMSRQFVWESSRPQVRLARMAQPIYRGGMNHIDIDLFTTSLRTRWYRILTRKAFGEAVNENWIYALNKWLEPYDIEASEIPHIGYKDMAKLGRLLSSRKCHFWGDNFLRYAKVVKLFEEQTDNPACLPIFGGLLQHTATKSTNSKVLTIFKSNPVYLFLFKHFKVVGDLFHIYNNNRVSLEEAKTPLEALSDFEFEDPRIRRRVFTGFKNVTTLIKQALLALPDYDQSCIKIVNQYPFSGRMHHLHNKCMSQPRGSSFVYKALINDKAIRQGLETPLAFITSQQDQNHGMTEEDWKRSLKRLSKIHCSTKTRWQNIQVFLRTIWTPMKQYFQTDILDDACCPGCADHWPANTAHLIYECSGLATNIWNFVCGLMQEVNNKPFRLSKWAVIYFHRITSYVEFGVIASAKRAIIRVVNSVNYPIHPKVAMRFLVTEINGTADTNICALRDTSQWQQIKAVTQSMWSEMKSRRNFIQPSPASF